MLGVVAASLLLLLVPVFITLPPLWADVEIIVEWMLWLVFLVEYVTRWYIAMDRATFIKHNVIDLIVVVLPRFPGLRVFRAIRLGRIAVIGARVVDQSDAIVKRSNVKYAIMLAGLIILLAAAMVWHVEHLDPKASIHTLPDALWWAVATVTTVGYGDKFPVSPEGKAIAISLMIIGIGVFGLVSATLASLFVERDAKDDYDDIREQMGRLEDKLDALLIASNGSLRRCNRGRAAHPMNQKASSGFFVRHATDATDERPGVLTAATSSPPRAGALTVLGSTYGSM